MPRNLISAADRRVHEAFHSYSVLYDKENYDYYFYKAIIPKGSTYYYNDFANELASSSIKVIRRITWLDRLLFKYKKKFDPNGKD